MAGERPLLSPGYFRRWPRKTVSTHFVSDSSHVLMCLPRHGRFRYPSLCQQFSTLRNSRAAIETQA
eukprot:4236675-Heterocapsa_arctica.AAC.1